MEPSGELALAAEFPTPDREQWLDLVQGVLRKSGADFGSLITTTYDNIDVQPLYTAAERAPDAGFPGLAPFTRGSRPQGAVEGWDVRQQHRVADREAVMADLENGVTSLWLKGLDPASYDDVLADVYLDLAPVIVDAGADFLAAGRAMLRVWDQRPVLAGEVRGNVGADPLGVQARTGQPADLAALTDLLGKAREFPELRLVVVDGLPFHEAGGSDAEELGASLAAGVAYLRHLTEAGLDVAHAVRLLEFRYAATADQFLTIAKFRAARRLWARVTEVAGAPSPQAQHAVTSPAMMTRRDPWVNMLRTTVACFGAGLGGADAVTVLPFDHAIGLSDDFSRRIARNTQSLLLEESKLAGVIDPAGGSWYVERLTDDLARAAWAWFREIEAAGGLPKAFDLVADQIADTWARRRANLADRSDAITGVSEFPNLAEQPVVRPPYPDEQPISRSAAPDRPGESLAASGQPSEGLVARAAQASPPGGPLDSLSQRGTTIPVGRGRALPRVRYAQDFEALRDAADAAAERPKVFLATLGPVAAHTARATFAANLFQAGGIETPNAGPTKTVEDVVAKFRESGARIACVCGSESSYAELAAPVAQALREAGAERVLLAGKKSEAAIDEYVFTGCPALEVLEHTFDALGVQR
ncbi:heterodimeric methylmalonyl-CoA mutase small subunit [Saccharothrix carnea]|uniref:Heterodimeric methylmalonyl-CoA mutase small subunit n=1 Tax=Saccharothrix carnea TaxID=1280637 RepID=A0A2P8I802_SACCR|nr:methylmalonyl-CoA mutase family protein [Saccharothrix carnea]PSL54570.1 heterodimeric methylmalonyl-CoA mutase small subunit [Saccharothrix carnea]